MGLRGYVLHHRDSHYCNNYTNYAVTQEMACTQLVHFIFKSAQNIISCFLAIHVFIVFGVHFVCFAIGHMVLMCSTEENISLFKLVT